MKAKLYIFEDQFEMKLSDDTVHQPGAKESKVKFIARMKEYVNNDLLDDEFEVIEIDSNVVASNDAKTLKAALEGGASGLQKKLIEKALASGKTADNKKEPRAKVEKVDVEIAKASEAYKAAEANIGKYVSFSPFKSLEVFEGKIAGIALNKTNTIIYYTVVEATGKRRCCGVLNDTIKFIDEPEDFKKTAAKPAKEKPIKEKAVKETTTKGTKVSSSKRDALDGGSTESTDLDGNAETDELM